MNPAQTKSEANRQIRLLMQDCTPGDQERLKKYLKPVPELPMQQQEGEPKRIGDILPHVMVAIRQRMERRRIEM
ncbi:hypothetical protein ACFL1G_10580 [Planctomycetota bacterium]